jgi:hypothetical protein
MLALPRPTCWSAMLVGLSAYPSPVESAASDSQTDRIKKRFHFWAERGQARCSGQLDYAHKTNTPDESPCPLGPSGQMDLVSALFFMMVEGRVKQANRWQIEQHPATSTAVCGRVRSSAVWLGSSSRAVRSVHRTEAGAGRQAAGLRRPRKSASDSRPVPPSRTSLAIHSEKMHFLYKVLVR